MTSSGRQAAAEHVAGADASGANASGRPPARNGISARRVVLRAGVVPEGEFFAARAGDSPFQPGTILPSGTVIERDLPAWCFPELKEEPEIKAQHEVLFVDEHLVVAHKPPFLPTTTNGRLQINTLQTRLRQEFGEELTPLHRLDRLASGVVLCGRIPEERAAYQRLFAQHHMQRTYLAKVSGVSEPGPWQSLELWMLKRPGQRAVQVVSPKTMGARRTFTEYRYLEDNLMELRPHTGFTHQLRVLCAHLSNPIVGDDTYPLDSGLNLNEGAKALALVAWKLSFIDPITGEDREFQTKRCEALESPRF